ncbi:MAG: ribokinase [Acidobacteria bacterium]|nr:ribokinase [Acidobacteriota bacterium]
MRFPVVPLGPHEKPFDAIAVGLNAVDHVAVVDGYPVFNTKIELVSHSTFFGGQCATAMVGLARLGMRTRYAGSVGDDLAGRLQLESLTSEGVDTSHVRVVGGAESQTSVILVDRSSGERTVMWRRDPRVRVEADGIPQHLITSARAFHCDGHNIEAEVRAASWAREAGIPTCIDVDFDYGGASLYPLIDYLVTSEEFPARMTGLTDPRSALVALRDRFGSPFVAMTLGRSGAIALQDGVFVESPGFVVDAVDTTGAGDAFHAGFLFGLLEGEDVESTLRLANAVAALNCTELGARSGLPSRPQLEAFLRTASTVQIF